MNEAQRVLYSEDMLIIEGVMGLFDGVAGAPGRTGSTADLATQLGLPVLLVLDVSGQSQTAAAVVRGLAGHDPGVRIAGVVLNRVGSERHRALVENAVDALDIPVLGAVPRDGALAMPERHLGLVQAQEHGDLMARLDGLADMAQRHLDLDRIVAMAAPLTVAAARDGPALPPPGQRIAVAADPAFTFFYPHLRAAGGGPAPKSWRFPRLPTSVRRTTATPAGSPAVIRSYMPVCWRTPVVSGRGCSNLR
jgi:cobyrinic acid a,c-diamide synthase